MSKGAVTSTVQRAAEKGLSWPLPADLDDGRLEAMLYCQAPPRREYAQPDYALMHREFKRNGTPGSRLGRATAVRRNPHLPRRWQLIEAPQATRQDAHRHTRRLGLIALSTQDRADLLEILDDRLLHEMLLYADDDDSVMHADVAQVCAWLVH